MQITTGILFLFLIVFCIGAAIGGVVERELQKRSVSFPPLLSSDMNILAKDDDVKVLSAWRTHGNKIWLDMDGTRLNDKAELQPGQYQRLLNLVLELRPWLETVHPPTPKAEPVPESLPPVAPVLGLTQLPVQMEKKNGAPVVQKVAPAPALDSIIQQIDKVLQARLATSAFKDRGIQLVEGAGGIVIVKDGIKRYEGIDAIPDPEIKVLIRQAVADWEKGSM